MKLLSIVILVALLITIGTLITGVGAMGRGGEFDERHSIQLMYARAAIQAVTFFLLLLALYLASS